MSTFSAWWTQLQAGSQPLPYVLMDCAGLKGGLAEVPKALFSELECLFTGELANELADVGGYLGRLKALDDATGQQLQAWFQQGVALVLLLPELRPGQGEEPNFSALHRHLRKFNVVYSPQGKPLFWRYYDPRTLPEVLETLDGPQLRGFFGPFASMALGDASGGVRCLAVAGEALSAS